MLIFIKFIAAIFAMFFIVMAFAAAKVFLDSFKEEDRFGKPASIFNVFVMGNMLSENGRKYLKLFRVSLLSALICAGLFALLIYLNPEYMPETVVVNKK
ncbi:hypothetical protein FLL45_14695 [Aliikangiella marina]|uniref:Uncharacterized protein n=1 Tax=Aliikangiella marina TaxID=1712262 RepID=A0A545TA53_9GAMM|nr:hypothetical protein [Aliikangiella marina]TQV74102.1 hypothetical protein FLL45_14695 [Aliikangiella marina]